MLSREISWLYLDKLRPLNSGLFPLSPVWGPIFQESTFKVRPIGRAVDDIFVMMSSFYLHHQSILGQRRPPLGNIMISPPFSCWFYHLGSSEEIESHLPEQGINSIFDQPREPGPKGIVVEVRDAKILFNNITNF